MVIIKVIYLQGGVKYSTTIDNVPDGSIQSALLKKKIAMSQVISWNGRKFAQANGALPLLNFQRQTLEV